MPPHGCLKALDMQKVENIEINCMFARHIQLARMDGRSEELRGAQTAPRLGKRTDANEQNAIYRMSHDGNHFVVMTARTTDPAAII